MDIGAELRAAREAKGLTLATLAQRIRVQPRILEAIETNNLAAIPPKPFGRGFVRSYAKEVNLDPANVVPNYFAQFPPAEPPPAREAVRAPAASSFDSSSHWTGFGAAIAILVVLVAAAALRAPGGASRSEPGAIGTSGAASKPEAAAPATTTPAAPATAAPVASAPKSSAPVSLAFTVTRPCWVTARVDGQRTIYKIVAPGESTSLEAQREIVVRFGDAGAVQATINGRQAGPLGANGAVKDLTITTGTTVDGR